MLEDRQLFYNLLVGDALLIYRGVAYPFEGPFGSKEDAERAADDLIERLDIDDPRPATDDLTLTRP